MKPWLVLLGLAACAHSRVPPLPESGGLDGEARAAAESLRTSLQAVVDGGWTPGRLKAVEARAAELGLSEHLRTEWIDWFSFQHNVVIELPGETDELVYVLAHADKADANLLKVVSLLFNGLLDEAIAWSFLTEGALDNASGTAIALELARALKDAKLRRTYRVLITGSEESGLRGARAHAARLSDAEWARLRFALNVDSVGSSGDQSCVIKGESNRDLAKLARQVAKEQGFDLRAGALPLGAGGDHSAFAEMSPGRDVLRGFMFGWLPGGILPQRSWFTRSHEGPVLVFADCNLLDAGDYLSALPFAFGRLHSFRDTADQIDPERLYRVYAVALEVLKRTDAQPTLSSSTSNTSVEFGGITGGKPPAP